MFEKHTDEVRQRLTWQLKNHLGGEGEKEYMRLWDAGVTLLANKSTTLPQYFRDVLLLTRRLCKRFSVDVETSRRIRKAVLDAFLAAEGGDSVGMGGPQDDGETEDTPSAKHVIFLALLDGFCKQHDTKSGKPGSLKQEFTASIEQLEASSRTKLVLERWSTTREFPGSFDRVPVADMQLAVYFVYSLISQDFGATVGGEIIADVAKEVEALPEATEFSPRELLEVTLQARVEEIA